MVPVIANLPGRHRDLEPNTIVTNVNNNQFPDTPVGFGGSGPLGSQGSAANSQAPSTPLGGAFLDQARAGNPATTGSGPGRPSLPINSPALNSNLPPTSTPVLSHPLAVFDCMVRH